MSAIQNVRFSERTLESELNCCIFVENLSVTQYLKLRRDRTLILRYKSPPSDHQVSYVEIMVTDGLCVPKILTVMIGLISAKPFH